VQIGQLNVFAGKTAAGPIDCSNALVSITGVRTKIENAKIEGTYSVGSNCVGLDIDGDFIRVMGGFVQRCLGASGIAIRMGHTAASNGCDIRCDTRNNANAFLYETQGEGNKFVGHLYQAAGQTGVHASSASPSNSDDFNVREFNSGGTDKNSRFYDVIDDVPVGSDGGGVAVYKYTTAAYSMLRVAHKLPSEWVPSARAVQVTLWSPTHQDIHPRRRSRCER
jgi:hypothetical protein